MQPIIVAVDFSNTSIHALEYSIPLANKLKSDIIMVWVDKIASTEGIYSDASTDNRNEAKRRFEELIRQYREGGYERYNPGLQTQEGKDLS